MRLISDMVFHLRCVVTGERKKGRYMKGVPVGRWTTLTCADWQREELEA
jgi:hypothetical protein